MFVMDLPVNSDQTLLWSFTGFKHSSEGGSSSEQALRLGGSPSEQDETAVRAGLNAHLLTLKLFLQESTAVATSRLTAWP